MKDIHLIIFDFDGTLADTKTAVKQAFWETLNEMNVSLSKPVPFHALLSQTLEGMFRSVGIEEHYRLEEAKQIYQDRYTIISNQKARLYPGVPEALDLLKHLGFELAIATNERRVNLDRLLDLTGITSCFSETVCEDEVNNAKPDPEMARTLIEVFDTPPHQTLVVGDSILDIRMGQVSGAFTCGAAFDEKAENALATSGADWIIRQFDELLTLLEIPQFESTAIH